MSGAYFSYGDLRERALEMAIESWPGAGTDEVIARAEAYFSFLTAGEPDG